MKPLSDLQADWPAINRLLDEALELPPAERSAWLDALPAEPAGLKDTVARLLAATGVVETGDFLHTLPKLGAAPVSTPDAPDIGTPQAGDEVGPWRLIRELGEGGMGSVWLAERADGSLKRQVALKLPRLSWQRGLAERMARERDILATLEHPHIARLYDAGVDKLGRPWLALEYVQGQPIDEHARSQGLDVKQRVQLLLQVCEAVAYAHSRLVIHRDLKPGNILVTDDRQVKLLDFGIAKLVQGGTLAAATLTRQAGAALTPAYASPEQLCGEPLTTASDVYSLGVVAYELLAGARPYRLERGSAAELEAAIVRAEIDPPSRVAAPAAQRALKGDVDAIVMRALARQPSQRHATVQSLADDLNRHLRGEKVQSRADTPWFWAQRLWRRHRLALAFAFAVLLAALAGAHAQAAVMTALAVGAAVALWQRQRALSQARRAEQERDAARRATAAADERLTAQRAVSDLYIGTFSRLSAQARERPEALLRPGAIGAVLGELLEEDLARRKHAAMAQRALLETVGVLLNFMDEFERALPLNRRLLDALVAAGAPAEEVILAHTSLGSTLYHLHRFEECAEVRLAGVRWRSAEDDPATRQARGALMAALGSVLSVLGRRREAGEWLERADRLIEQVAPMGEARRTTLSYLATFHAGTAPARALASARQAQAWLAANAGRVPIEGEQSTLNHVAAALSANERWDEAAALLARSAVLAGEFYGNESPQRARDLALAATVHARAGRHDEALRSLDAWFAEYRGPAREAAELMHRARAVELAWLHGQVAVTEFDGYGFDRMRSDPWQSDVDQLAVARARALLLAGHVDAARAGLAYIEQRWPAARVLTALGTRVRQLRLLLVVSVDGPDGRQLALEAAAGVIDELAQVDAQGCWTWRVAHEVAALCCLRLGDMAGAARHATAVREAMAVPAPSVAERGESALRRCELAQALGDAAAAAASLLQARADLQGQHTDSPRALCLRQLSAMPSTQTGEVAA